MPNKKVPSKGLPIIMLDSVTKVNKKYYPQALLEECKCVQYISVSLSKTT